MGCYRDEPERSVWGVGTGGVGGREIRGRDGAGGGSGKEWEVGILKRRKWEN